MQKLSTLHLTRHFSKTHVICSAFMSLVLKYAGVGEGNLFFFGGGEKRERKSSFADVGFGAGGAVCKCAFSCAAGLFFLLFEIG